MEKEEKKRKRCTHRFKYQHETKKGLYHYKCSKCKKSRWLEKAVEDLVSCPPHSQQTIKDNT